MKNAVALIDYDNVKDGEEKREIDVSLNLASMIHRLTHHIQYLCPEIEDVRYRLYGGWSLRDGQDSFQCGWLLAALPLIRIKHGSVRTRCSLAREIVARPDLNFIGTYRDKKQKMVDEMITADMIHLSADTSISIILVSNDDDFVPGIIMGSVNRSRRNPMIVIRPTKESREGLNDHLLDRCHVNLSDL